MCLAKIRPLNYPGNRSAHESIKELTGTFDFKWPQGWSIRVAVLEPPPEAGVDDHGWALRHLSSLAARWMKPFRGQLPSIRFAFDQRMVAPGQEGDYDVLISLAPLPKVVLHGGREPDEVVVFPQSELGTYCLRLDQGRPSMYLGKPERFSTWRKFAEDAEGVQAILHELGHALGLPHPHQNPLTQKKWRKQKDWKSRGAILDMIETRLDRKLDDTSFIEAQITGEWPISNTYRFSEWSDAVPELVNGFPEFHSVMVHPMYRSFLVDGPEFDGKGFRKSPGENDLIDLHRLYPPTAGGGAAKAPSMP